MRWLRLRHPEGFSDEMFECFVSGCLLWETMVNACIRERSRLGQSEGDPKYVCLEPELSEDRTVASLPVTGHQTVGSRAHYENGLSHLLRHFMPITFVLSLEEGLTEDLGGGAGVTTHWRRAIKSTGRVTQ